MTTLLFLGGIALLFLLFVIYDYKTGFMKFEHLSNLANKNTNSNLSKSLKFSESESWLDKNDMRSPSYEWPDERN